MSISILNRGASGGMKPELIVTAPAGSTIDLLQNGIIVDTYTLGADETEHTFVVKVGTYAVRGTLGSQTKSVDAVIDVVGRYEVEITYIMWLYNLGDECEDVTGGWVATKCINSASYSLQTATKNADNLYCATSAGMRGAGFSTNNKVSLTGYTKLYCEVVDRYQEWGMALGVNTDNQFINTNEGWNVHIPSVGTTVFNFNISQEAYVVFGCWHTTNRMAVSKIWLE